MSGVIIVTKNAQTVVYHVSKRPVPNRDEIGPVRDMWANLELDTGDLNRF